MDSAAVRELQRLYAKKHGVSQGRPSKKRRIDAIDEPAARRSVELGEIDSASDSSRSDVDIDAEGSFTAFDDDANVLDAAQTTEGVEIVTFDASKVNPTSDVATDGYKSFISGKTPNTGTTTTKQGRRGGTVDAGEADDLLKDKELQRLLRDSDLLRQQGDGTLEATGKTRHKVMAAQRLALGAAAPKARKMPIGMRKGIEAAAEKRAAAQDKYVRENGIVTARKSEPIKKKKSNKTLHELNLGKYKNGKLSISRAEIERINGPRGAAAKGKKKRGFRDFSNIG